MDIKLPTIFIKKKGVKHMKRFDLYLPDDLYERIKILSKKYNLSTTKMMIKLLEVGYLRFLNTGNKINLD